MYKFNEELHSELFMKIPKIYFSSGAWAGLNSAGKAIYPVILKFANKNGLSYPSQETIGIVSGIAQKTVRTGIESLLKFPNFSLNKRLTNRGHYLCHYRIKPAYRVDSKTIFINHAFFNGGNWQQLSSIGKAVYPVLKHFSWWNPELYGDLQNEYIAPIETLDTYKYREFDFAFPEYQAIAELSGVNIRSIPSAMKSLADCEFIEKTDPVDGHMTFKLFVEPPHTFPIKHLNKVHSTM